MFESRRGHVHRRRSPMPDETDEADELRVTRRTLLGVGAAFATLSGCTATGPKPASRPATTSATTSHPATRATAAPSSAVPKTASRTPIGPAREVGRGPGLRPEVALTFHGAGDPALARRILAVLAAARARVTVLAVGRWLAAEPGLAGAIVSAGHELGNHTWSHPSLAVLGRADTRAEIERCREGESRWVV